MSLENHVVLERRAQKKKTHTVMGVCIYVKKTQLRELPMAKSK